MPKIKLNGKEVEVAPGKTVLQACVDNGAFVPHYCWHPGLSPAGNCRMCLVKVSNSRKLEASCMYPCSDNLEVTTEGPEVAKGRQDVLEFMLINHPLDCPICDKAGECDLQDYTYAYRGGVSRFRDKKVIKHTKDLGPNVRIWGSRCIACTRCVRFCEEVAGTGELCLVNRGDHSVVDVFPTIPIDNPVSLNVVDLCPVGALIDRNFLYQARVWFARETESVCASCARGCNVKITALDNRIKRMVPRVNADVNTWWMCDEGRLNTRYLADDRRLTASKGSARDLDAAARKGNFGIVLSTYQTIEEMWLVKRLAEAWKAPVGFLTLTRGERKKFGGLVIEPDKTPNRRFAEKLFGELKPVPAGCKGLFVLNGIPELEGPPELMAAANGAEFLAVSDLRKGPLVEKAQVVLPACAWAEKDGTFMNVDGRVQRIRKAIEPPAAVRAEVAWLQEALGTEPLSAEGVFLQAAKEVPALAGLDYGKLGNQGAASNGH
ncbi:MAG: (2Fe-2S)-binding protein [Planctomycetes bacterium]|nr:(2Fe-2S)-binding protein [Planctomycetota bacterium]